MSLGKHCQTEDIYIDVYLFHLPTCSFSIMYIDAEKGSG